MRQERMVRRASRRGRDRRHPAPQAAGPRFHVPAPPDEAVDESDELLARIDRVLSEARAA
jgi:hypothetical protein